MAIQAPAGTFLRAERTMVSYKCILYTDFLTILSHNQVALDSTSYCTVFKASCLSSSVFCLIIGEPEQALGWFPLGLGLVMEDEPSNLHVYAHAHFSF